MLTSTPPVLTIIALEEPENHIAPHLMGKLIKNLINIAKKTNAQASFIYLYWSDNFSLSGRVMLRTSVLKNSAFIRKYLKLLTQVEYRLYHLVVGM